MRAMILAAGRGERMRPLTDATPKPLLRAGGKPLIEYHIEALAAAGVRDIVVNVAWKRDMFKAALGDGSAYGVTLHFSDERNEVLETGGGVFKALPLLGPDAFIVVSGDIWSDFPFDSLRERLAEDDVAHFVLVPNPAFHTEGDFALNAGRITMAPARHTYANIGVYHPRFFAQSRPGRFPLAPLMREWIAENRVSGELYRGVWRNIGTPTQLVALDRELSDG